jgi:hypothetical protein
MPKQMRVVKKIEIKKNLPRLLLPFLRRLQLCVYPWHSSPPTHTKKKEKGSNLSFLFSTYAHKKKRSFSDITFLYISIQHFSM